MQSILVNISIAFRSLFQHGKRSIFLGTAIAGVTALLVMLDGLSAGIRHTMIHTATTLTTGHVNVGGFYKVTAGQSAPVVTEYARVMDFVRSHVPEMAFQVQRGRGWAKLVSDTGSMQAGIGGIDIESEPEFPRVLDVVSGTITDLAQPNTIMLFEGQLKNLNARVGDAITISAQTTRGVANTIDVRVVAIAKDIGLLSKWNVYVPTQTLRDLYQIREDATGAVHILLNDEKDAKPVAARLRRDLERAGYRMMESDSRTFWMKFETVNREDWTGQKLDVTTWEDELSFLTWTLDVLNWLTRVLLLILMAIIVTGILNTLWIAIRERTREIGTLRAIGMQRGGVLQLFMGEAVLLGLMGSVVGALMASLVAMGLNAAHIPVPLTVQLFLMSDQLHLVLEPARLVSRIALITGVTGIAALFPSMRAARLKPVEAMSHFG